MFIFFLPEAIMFLRCLRIIAFKSWKVPGALEFLSYFVTETLPTIGYAILAFDVLPNLDIIKGAMLMNAVCFIPACLCKVLEFVLKIELRNFCFCSNFFAKSKTL